MTYRRRFFWGPQVNSNCGALSNRTGMVQAIMDLGLVRVDAWGPCLRNQNVTGRLESKYDTFRQYKFCIAIKNSIEGEYLVRHQYYYRRVSSWKRHTRKDMVHVQASKGGPNCLRKAFALSSNNVLLCMYSPRKSASIYRCQTHIQRFFAGIR